MTDTIYDNPSHWKQMHLSFPGSLRAIGRSGLSEIYNRYKYLSEQETFTEAVRLILNGKNRPGHTFNVLDIGAGSGYWMNVIKVIAENYRTPVQFTGIDLSEKALEVLKTNLPEAAGVLENAGTMDPESFHERFDLVMSNYCLHHITNTSQYLNALHLAVNSVKPGGYLLLMDCLIDLPYSPYYSVDATTFKGSGLSRPLVWTEAACAEKHLGRIWMAQPVSFLMNNVLEAGSAVDFRLMRVIWKMLHRLYKSTIASRMLMPLIFHADRYLKKRNRGYSTRLVLYKKEKV